MRQVLMDADSLENKINKAQSSQGEELWKYIRDSHPQILINAIYNLNLTEEMAVFIAKRRSTPAEALCILANDIRYRDSYKLKLAICRNPKTPQRVSFSLLKFLRLFDLADITRDQTVPITLRQKTEMILAQKIPTMPSGIKKALSKRASSSIILSLIERGDRDVINTCLDSPAITESHICSLINKPNLKPAVLLILSEHKKWSMRYFIRYALILNNETPTVYSSKFISGMKTRDLQELYSNPDIPGSVRPFIYSELIERGASVEPLQEDTYEIYEDSSLE